MSTKGKQYTPEFREQAVKRVIENSQPIVKVARELDVNVKTLGAWVADRKRKNAAQPFPENTSGSDREKAMEKRIRELEMEVSFLKKAAAYFAREQR